MDKPDLTIVLEKVELSHKAISDTISNFGNDIRETNSKIENIEEVLTDHGKTIEKMLEQTTKTNGNVRSLQLWQAGIKGTVYGAGVCVSIIIALITGIFWIQVGSLEGMVNGVEKLLNQHISQTK
jgi:hypothetical protein